MSRTLITAAALAASLGGVAFAQTAGSSAGAAGGPPSTDNSLSSPREADPAPPTSTSPAEGLKPGMPVVDTAGELVGTINRIGQTADGTPAVELDVGGKAVPMAMAALTLSPKRDQAISRFRRAEVEAAAERATP